VESPLIFAADALVRFKGGRILIHTTSSKLPAFESDSPVLIGLLCQFAKPTRTDVAVGALQASDRAMVTEIIDYLKRSGTLVEAGSSAALAPEDGEVMIRIKNHLRLLARSFYDVACDLLAFGPYADSEMTKRSAAGVERRLLALLAGTDGLRTELGDLRQGYVARQLEALNVNARAREHKLHIGCGKALLDDWINIDVHPAPLSMNVLWGLPFADGSVRCIFVSHLLEHLFFPRDVKPFLAEIRRVLAPQGIVRFTQSGFRRHHFWMFIFVALLKGGKVRFQFGQGQLNGSDRGIPRDRRRDAVGVVDRGQGEQERANPGAPVIPHRFPLSPAQSAAVSANLVSAVNSSRQPPGTEREEV